MLLNSPVAASIVAMRAVLQAAQPAAVRSHPQRTIVVFVERHHFVAAQAIVHRPGGDAPVGDAARAAAERSHPHGARTILEQRADVVVTQSVGA